MGLRLLRDKSKDTEYSREKTPPNLKLVFEKDRYTLDTFNKLDNERFQSGV